MIIKLKYPIIKKSQFGDVIIDEINLRRPKIFDFFGLSFENEKSAESMTILISRLSGLSTEVIIEIDGMDMLRINEWISKTQVS